MTGLTIPLDVNDYVVYACTLLDPKRIDGFVQNENGWILNKFGKKVY